MNNPDFEQPALTAHALGELGPAEAATVRRMIATSPEVRAEYERIAQTVAAMKKAPPIPRRTLSQRQRETVLAMGQAPSRGAKVIPFRKRDNRATGSTWGVAKFAAAACVALGAFVLGQKYAASDDENLGLASAQSEPTRQDLKAAPMPVVATSSIPASEAHEPAPDASLFEVVQQPPIIEALWVASSGAQASPATDRPVEPSHRQATPPRPIAPSIVTLKSFTVAATQPGSTISLQPQLMRVTSKPVPREFAGQILAAPIQEKPKASRTASPSIKPEPQPPLVMHSWKAEIASCPWDSSRRLMRFVAQIPVDQDGIETNSRDYQISVKFDPAQVQAWRLITEKHMPPSNGGLLATRFAWYEIIPSRNFSPKAGKPATLGLLDIVQPRGLPHDSQPLKLVDRGLAWNDAREDFVFETAMVGFNLLLQGRENIGALNYKLVLDLAQQSKDEDPKGERHKFITAVKQAQKAAGL